MVDNSDRPTIISPDGGRPGGAPSGPVPGQRWGKFLIEKVLGRGGQADVLQAFDQAGAAGHVALKVPHSTIPAPCLQEWLESEVGTLARLDHPNIVRVMDAGTVGDCPYVATALVDGLPMRDYVRTAPPSGRQIADWMLQLCDALDSAHRRGVTHRDLKPDNVIVTPGGKPLLIDFGLASLVSAYQSEGRRDASGTYPFMAPEQARRDPGADHRVDIFGLGGILKFLLTGEGPYQGASNAIEAARSGDVQRVGPIGGSALRRSLGRIADRAMAADPAGRYANMAEMARAVARARSRRLTALLGLAGVVIAAVVAAAVLMAGPREGPAQAGGDGAGRQEQGGGETPAGAKQATLSVLCRRHGLRGEYFSPVEELRIPPRPGDAIRIEARLPEPLYAYLLIVRPDGRASALHPAAGVEASKTSKVVWPPAGRNETLREEGLHMVVLLAGKEPADAAELLAGRLRAPAFQLLSKTRATILVDNDETAPRMVSRTGVERTVVQPAAGDDVKLFGWLAAAREKWDVVRLVAFPLLPLERGGGVREQVPGRPARSGRPGDTGAD